MKKILSFIFIVIVLQSKANIYYIDATGGSTSSDSYDGTQQTHTTGTTGPWATLTKVNSFFSSLTAGDQILFNRGQSWTGTITINKSGSSGNPIIIGAYGSGAAPIITGLLPLTWIGAGTNLWHSNSTLAPLTSSMVMCVTKNNLVTPMGRWPNPTTSGTDFGLGKGWATIAAATVAATSTITETNSEIAGHPSTGSMPGSWVFFKGARYWIETWIITTFTVSGSPSVRKISFHTTTNGVSDPTATWGYSIENNPETVTYQDAWYFDPVNNWILMYSIGSPTGISASNSLNLLKSNGFSYITVDGLEFNGSNEDAINVIGGNHFIVQNCNIHNVGRNAIKSDDQNTSVLNNTITDCQSKGVTFLSNGGGSSSGNPTVVQGNIITNMGQFEGMGDGSQESRSPWSLSDSDANHSGVAAYIEQDNTNNILVQLNTITNCGYAAVAIKRSSNITITKNVINIFCNITDDGGGVYSVMNNDNTGPIIWSGRTISSNVISNAIGSSRGRTSPNTATSGNAGIYCDNATSNENIQANVIFNCGKGIFCNNGTDHLNVTNNTIYNCVFGIQVNTDAAAHGSWSGKSRFLTFTGNLIFVKNLRIGNTTSSNPAEYAFLIHTANSDPTDSITHIGGTINSNKYIKPVSTLLLMLEQTSSDLKYSLAQWQTRFNAVNFDPSSGTSVTPYTYTDTTIQNNNVLFIYNATNSPSTRSLPFKYINDYGVAFNSGSIVLSAFTAQVLYKTGNLVNNSDSKLMINGKLILK